MKVSIERFQLVFSPDISYRFLRTADTSRMHEWERNSTALLNRSVVIQTERSLLVGESCVICSQNLFELIRTIFLHILHVNGSLLASQSFHPQSSDAFKMDTANATMSVPGENICSICTKSVSRPRRFLLKGAVTIFCSKCAKREPTVPLGD